MLCFHFGLVLFGLILSLSQSAVQYYGPKFHPLSGGENYPLVATASALSAQHSLIKINGK